MGIHVQATDFTHVPIHDHPPIPQEYNEFPHIIKRGNYPNSDEMEDFDRFHSNLDATLSQITDINTHFSSDDEDDIFDFVSDNVSVSSISSKKNKIFYSQLYPNFKDAVNWINNQEEDEFSKMIDKFISDINVKYQSANDVTKNQVYIYQVIYPLKNKNNIMVVADRIHQTKEKGDTIYLRKLHLILYHKRLLILSYDVELKMKSYGGCSICLHDDINLK